MFSKTRKQIFNQWKQIQPFPNNVCEGSTLGSSVEKRQEVQKSRDKKTYIHLGTPRLIFALNAPKLNEVTAKLQQKSHLGSRYALVIKCRHSVQDHGVIFD